MNLNNLKSLLSANGCKNIYLKKLSPNDNSKNQVYLGGGFDILNIFPISDIISVPKGKWIRDRFTATIRFSWITDDGRLVQADHAQFILYPKYPEVRFSGFLRNCPDAPSELMKSREEGRILFLAVTADGRVLGHVVDGTSELAGEFLTLSNLPTHGLFSIIEIENRTENRLRLLSEMHRIHNLGWIDSVRLKSTGELIPCNSPNCGGYTLEAELGVLPNGFSEPDYLGWEIKQFSARNFERFGGEVLTLMTPEPTHGYYKISGVEAFVRKYGYTDKKGREDRLNFGGNYRVGKERSTTDLRLMLTGFDSETKKITSSEGRIGLVDESGNEAASWSFASLLKHWNRKHNLACYVPSQKRKDALQQQYRYGNNLILGTGTDFILFLEQMNLGHIYYDPGIKLENASTHPTTKRRSQFRMTSCYLPELYYSHEFVDISK